MLLSQTVNQDRNVQDKERSVQDVQVYIDALTHVLHIYLSRTLGTGLQSDAALSDSESGQKRSGQRQKRSGRPGLVDTIDALTHVLHIYISRTLGTGLQSVAALSDSESGQKRSGQRQKRSGRPGLVDTIDALTHVLHIYISRTLGTGLQSVAALSDSEAGQKRSGQIQERSGRPGLVDTTHVDALTHVLHISLSRTLGTGLQSDADLPDSESGQEKKYPGSARGRRGIKYIYNHFFLL